MNSPAVTDPFFLLITPRPLKQYAPEELYETSPEYSLPLSVVNAHGVRPLPQPLDLPLAARSRARTAISRAFFAAARPQSAARSAPLLATVRCFACAAACSASAAAC